MKLLIDHIAPDPVPPAAYIFYFYHHAEEHGSCISRIAHQIEQMDPEMKRQVELALDLQLLLAPRDASGNVCFVDSPDLRPEFRTTFGPIDLWDYYYALFHSNNWWKSRSATDHELPPPSADQFWTINRLGKKLRRIHSSKIRTEKYQFDLRISGNSPIQPVSARFQPDPNQSNIGRLYLNDQDYIGQVPRRAWTFHLGELHFLPDYVTKCSGHYPDSKIIRLLMEWIAVIDRTAGISAAISSVLYSVL